MTEGKSCPASRGVVTVVLVVLIGMFAGGAFNASLGEQGADTPAFVLIGGALGLGCAIVVRARRRARESRND